MMSFIKVTWGCSPVQMGNTPTLSTQNKIVGIGFLVYTFDHAYMYAVDTV